jgi:hypothetical protein
MAKRVTKSASAHSGMVTVIEVAAEMGVELPKKTAWSVGTAVATAYRSVYGAQPIKNNRPKTNGGGSHCFALYPQTFVPIIQEAIERAGAEKDRQARLL